MTPEFLIMYIYRQDRLLESRNRNLFIDLKRKAGNELGHKIKEGKDFMSVMLNDIFVLSQKLSARSSRL
jgi:hypothetical protein